MAKKKLVSSAQVSDAEATFTAFMVGKLTRMGASKAAAKFRGNGPLVKRQTKKWLQKYADDGGDAGDMASFLEWLMAHADEIISFISKIILLFAIALLLMFSLAASPAFAQVTIAPTSKMGEPLVATLAIPEVEGQKNSVTLTASDGIGFKQYGNEIPVWPSSGGKFWLQADVQTEIHGSRDVLVPGEKWPEDPADIKRETITFLVDRTTKTHRVEFEVEGGAPVPPPLPEPKPGSLGALVPAEAREPLAEFYADWASTVRSGVIASTSHFRTAHQQSATALQTAGKLPSLAAVNKPISDKIATAIGLADAALDVAKRELLAAALDAVASEFRGQ